MTTQDSQSDDVFATTTAGLPEAVSTPGIRIGDGERLGLRIRPVRKRINDDDLRMLAYNDSIPGPTLHVDQGSEITVDVVNEGDEMTTVHWHGLRLENRFDGVPHDTQRPIPVGGSFTYQVQFPDAGIYWYHPHLREDFAQEMGLYGAIVVRPRDGSFWPAADREIVLILDDLLLEGGRIAPFKRSGPTYTAMGRFGNVLLVNGETEFSGEAAVGEVLRLYLVNTANTRIFNFRLAGARMKLVGGDSGRYERETFVDEVLIAPSERFVVDVLFSEEGDVQMEHRTPDRVYVLGKFAVSGTAAAQSISSYEVLRIDEELSSERQSLQRDIERPPDKTLSFVASMPLLYGNEPPAADSYSCPMHPEVTDKQPSTCPKCGMKLVPHAPTAEVTYACPMHPEVTDSQPSMCPECGMKLVRQAMTAGSTYVCPMHSEVTDTQPSTCPKCGMKLIAQPTGSVPPEHGKKDVSAHAEHEESDGIEWEDLMLDINRASDPTNMIWKIIDRETGSENAAISWNFKVGDRVKIRLVNEMESDHPMHHPFHIHGAGRFLVLSRDGETESNLVWKDTVLVRMGETVDILLDVSNAGIWMAHCHIAEHIESGMMFSFNVTRDS